jgi:hypothetical protein
MPSTPPPLWPGYDETSEDDLLELLDGKDAAAADGDDPTVNTAVATALATAVARHEAIKQEQDPDNYRRRVHERAASLAGGWRP